MAQILLQWKKSFRNSLRISRNPTKTRFSDAIPTEVLDQFESAETTILNWKDNTESFICKGYIDEAKDYLSAVDTLLANESLLVDNVISDRFDTVKKMSMLRLEDEFRNMLMSEELCSKGSFRVSDVSSDEHDNVEKKRDNLIVDSLKVIAKRMVKGDCERECGSVYVNARRDYMCDCLRILGAQKVSIEDLQKLDWKFLDKKMKNWIQAVKTVTRYLLFSERDLCVNVFTDDGEMIEACFTLIAEESVLRLMNFGRVIVKVDRSPEMLLRLFDMYDTLSKSMGLLEDLFSCGFGEFVFSQVDHVMANLREAVVDTFEVFVKKVQYDTSPVIPNGDIPRLASYVMNYVPLIVDCGERLNKLFGGNMGDRILELITALETNLEWKSNLYEEESLSLIFLVSTTNHMVLKVKKNEKLRLLLGENWLREHKSILRKYSELYLRSSWKNVLKLLNGSGIIEDAHVKDKFRDFNTALEEIYKRQSAWLISEPQLRDELRISISEKLIPAYNTFLGWIGLQVDRLRHPDKHRKYEIEDLDNLLMDLFQGKAQDLRNGKWKLRDVLETGILSN